MNRATFSSPTWSISLRSILRFISIFDKPPKTIFWDATPEDKRIFVANPAEGSRHNRGCAVDLTLYGLKTGAPIEMTGVYDEMSERSYPFYPGGTSLQRWHRDLLRHAMEAEGFDVYEFEWWHFDYKDWSRYPILNLTFDKLGSAGSDNQKSQ